MHRRRRGAGADDSCTVPLAGTLEVAKVNIPVGLLIWVMIIPMLLRIDFYALREVRKHWRGFGVTLFINWAVKPFTMALLGWLFIRQLFAQYLPAEQIDSYIAGLILLAAAPCTAMVFVWSRLVNGEPLFTLSQVALNDTIMVFAYAPLVALLLGISSIIVPWDTLIVSVVLYIIVPVLLAQLWRKYLLARGGQAALHRVLGMLNPISIVALLLTLVLLFAFQGEAIVAQPLDHPDACRADHHPGVLRLGPCLLAQPPFRRSALRGRTIGIDRRIQLLRTRRGGRHQSVRLSVRRGAGDGGGSVDRGAGDAERGLSGEAQPGVVRAGLSFLVPGR